MAPKKEKTEKVSASAQEDMVYQYLMKQNRPYSATDVSANLHNKVTKSAAQKILIKLHEAKKIEGRVSGKQSVYHAIQNQDDALTPEQLAALDAQIQKLRDQSASLATQTKTLRATLAQLNSSLSTADLRAEVAAMQAEKVQIEGRLLKLRSGCVKSVSEEESNRVEKEARVLERSVCARRGIVKEMWSIIAEIVPKEECDDLKERLGVII